MNNITLPDSNEICKLADSFTNQSKHAIEALSLAIDKAKTKEERMYYANLIYKIPNNQLIILLVFLGTTAVACSLVKYHANSSKQE